MIISFYQNEDKTEWDNLVSRSVAPHFIFKRDFLEHHSEKYVEYTLTCRDENGQLIAGFPGSKSSVDSISSHGYLTFGGLVTAEGINALKIFEIWKEMLDYLHNDGIKSCHIKFVPEIYSKHVNQEFLWCVLSLGCHVTAAEPCSFIPLDGYEFPSKKMGSVRKALKSGCCLSSNVDPSKSMGFVIQNLFDAHGIVAAHTVDQLTKLISKFPENIEVFNVVNVDHELLACGIVFKADFVWHMQYMSVSVSGKKVRAMEFLIYHIISDAKKVARHFSFGISSENFGKRVNFSLMKQKQEYGSHIVCHSHADVCVSSSLANAVKSGF